MDSKRWHLPYSERSKPEHMVRKQKSTRKVKRTTPSDATKKEPVNTKSDRSHEGDKELKETMSAVAKKAGKGALKGAAKELLK